MSAANVFTGTHPDRVRVRGINSDITDGVRGLVVENRRPGYAGIGGLPDTTGANGYVPDAVVSRVPVDIGDTTRHESRADIAPLKAAVWVLFFVVIVGEGVGCKRHDGT